MNRWPLLLLIVLTTNCTGIKQINFPERRSNITGSEFYRIATSMQWKARDSFAVKEILAGGIPNFLEKFKPVKILYTDSIKRKKYKLVFYVTPDYLSIGTNKDWARINITPQAAQKIADSIDCFLPTRKMVDDIYNTATVRLEPVPMYAFRDSTPTMWQHHLIIEGQRKGKTGLIAGIKKDIVISGKITRDVKPNRVAIYGWHQLNGKPIQPLYTRHIFSWVDYSQGIRLIYRKIKVNGEWMDYTDILSNPELKNLLCDEEFCDFYRYTY